SFGAGGSNAHVVVEEAPDAVPLIREEKLYYLLLLSAKHPDSLREKIKQLKDYLAQNSQLLLPDVSFTLNTGREHFAYRVAFVVASLEDAIVQLNQAHLSFQRVNDLGNYDQFAQWLKNLQTTQQAEVY